MESHTLFVSFPMLGFIAGGSGELERRKEVPEEDKITYSLQYKHSFYFRLNVLCLYEDRTVLLVSLLRPYSIFPSQIPFHTAFNSCTTSKIIILLDFLLIFLDHLTPSPLASCCIFHLELGNGHLKPLEDLQRPQMYFHAHSIMLYTLYG